MLFRTPFKKKGHDAMFAKNLWEDPLYYFTWIGIVVLSVCLHELSHAVCAYWQGDDTAKSKGYFTLNPLVHMGRESLVLLALLGIAWGLCPVNPSKFKHNWSDMAVSFAGPLMNLFLMLVFILMQAVVHRSNYVPLLDLPLEMLSLFDWILGLAAWANAYLFLLNMIPVPPLDGFNVLSYFFKPIQKLGTALTQSGSSSFAFIIVLFLLSPEIGKMALGFYKMAFHHVIDWVTFVT
jgi:Zn-dependent protease